MEFPFHCRTDVGDPRLVVPLLPEAGEWGRGYHLTPKTPPKSVGSSAIQPVRSTVGESTKYQASLFPVYSPSATLFIAARVSAIPR